MDGDLNQTLFLATLNHSKPSSSNRESMQEKLKLAARLAPTNDGDDDGDSIGAVMGKSLQHVKVDH